jgi:TolB-like protein/Tfp pilus assembly protein PilF
MAAGDHQADGRPLSKESAAAIRKHLRLVVGSHAFVRSKRAQEFLTLVVNHAISGRYSSLRERMIGAELFGRSIDYDTGSDSVVRVMATEVRKRLGQFYLESPGEQWAVRFEFPTGSYVPVFVFTAAKTAAEDEQTEDEPGKVEPEAAKPPVQMAPADATPALQPHLSNDIEDAPKPELTASAAEDTSVRKKRRIYRWIASGVLIALAAIGVYTLLYRMTHRRTQIRSVVILPLKNLSGDPSQDFFSDSFTAELINQLGQNPALRVISLTSSMNLKGSPKMIPEIARELDVQGVIEGSVEKEGNRIRISVDLIDGRTDEPIWAQTYVRDVNSVLNLQGEVAAEIAEDIETTISQRGQVRADGKHIISPAAHDYYLHGLLLLNAEEDADALTSLREAVRIDPKSPQAHAALAECLGRMAVSGVMPYREAYAAQKSEAEQAIALDPSQAEAHAELAEAVMSLDWDWQTAGQEFNRALELNPNSAYTHQKYAIYLLYQGRTAEAIAQADAGAELAPTSALSFRNQAFVYLFARQYDKTLKFVEATRAMGLEPPGWNFFMAGAYTGKGQYKAAIDLFLKAQKSPHTLGHLGNAYALAGENQAALKTIAELEDGLRTQSIGAYEIALVYAGLGDKKNALVWLKKAYDAHDVGLLYIKIDPGLDPLRGEPEFQDLIRRVGLTP